MVVKIYGRHARGREHCRGEPGGALSGGYAPRLGEGGKQLDRRRARGMLNPCARESKARTGRFLRKKLISDHGLFSSYEGQQGTANGQDSWGVFQGCTGLWTAGSWLVCRLHQLKASTTTMDLGISLFFISI